MLIRRHTVDDYAAALMSLLPPGDAWQWSLDSAGYLLLKCTAQELARVDDQVQGILDLAITKHKIKATKWSFSEYLSVARSSQLGDAAKNSLRVERVNPLLAGFHAGDRCWSARARFILMVIYDSATVDVAALWLALLAFKQEHTFLWVVDLNGYPTGGWHVQN